MRQKTIAGHYRERGLPDEQYNALLEEWGFKAEDLHDDESFT
jgi:tRNA (guanosine-2'-O-)-methyltransferase